MSFKKPVKGHIFVEYFFAEHVYYFSIVKSIYCATLSSEHMSIYKRIW